MTSRSILRHCCQGSTSERFYPDFCVFRQVVISHTFFGLLTDLSPKFSLAKVCVITVEPQILWTVKNLKSNQYQPPGLELNGTLSALTN